MIRGWNFAAICNFIRSSDFERARFNENPQSLLPSRFFSREHDFVTFHVAVVRRKIRKHENVENFRTERVIFRHARLTRMEKTKVWKAWELSKWKNEIRQFCSRETILINIEWNSFRPVSLLWCAFVILQTYNTSNCNTNY